MRSTHAEAGIMTDLEGRKLDEALARAMGWKRGDGVTDDCWVDHNETHHAELPHYHASLDALLRDIEPVCRERGMLRLSIEQVGEERWEGCARMAVGVRYESGYGPTAATALARAFLVVLTRGER